MIQLPKGYYAVAADFESGSKDTFTYRGVSYAVSEGANLFATPLEALEAATDIPDVVLDGLDYDSFDTPVILFSVGTHRIDKLRIEKPIALLGEKAGVSPNLAAATIAVAEGPPPACSVLTAGTFLSSCGKVETEISVSRTQAPIPMMSLMPCPQNREA